LPWGVGKIHESCVTHNAYPATRPKLRPGDMPNIIKNEISNAPSRI